MQTTAAIVRLRLGLQPDHLPFTRANHVITDARTTADYAMLIRPIKAMLLFKLVLLRDCYLAMRGRGARFTERAPT